ncbi:periplasmic heavy metal sensor [Desulfoluna sp.]|uniref:periplasmic heavy metal sensor n=1 Tax=Desulfoluna sp. TaxID=2045199 RepID=UPI0026233EC3|nr:periplasmic heavy metal sensor [Desulfoluna sp.]
MKKALLILIALAITGFSATQALAGRGHHGSMDGNGRDCTQNMTDEQIQARQAFMKDTADLRQSLAVKKGEYRALMAGDNPDPTTAGKLAGEIAGLKNQLREKAVAAGVPFRGRGMGQGMGDGPHQRQGNCNW